MAIIANKNDLLPTIRGLCARRSGLFFPVYQLRVFRLDGQAVPYDLPHYPDGVAILAITTSGQIALRREFRPSRLLNPVREQLPELVGAHRPALPRVEDGMAYDLIGGFVEPDEDVNDAACREFREETGSALDVENLISVGKLSRGGYILGYDWAFVASLCQLNGGTVCDHGELVLVSPDRLRQLLPEMSYYGTARFALDYAERSGLL